MSWKNILKAPMPVGTRQNRDENFKQAIIDYEQNVIEPALTEFFSSNEATTYDEFSIIAAKDDDGQSGLRLNHGYKGGEKPAFVISEEDVQKLGSNLGFIIDTISDLYVREGYSARKPYNNIVTLKEKEQGE